ncbi:MAG: hypothetical protein QOJ57_2068 [Thermoleophilaceae bacterium]|nr:hypothetical protein [Thermoleophilaceae bacterium]
MLAQLSNAMVRLYKQHFGKGPTRVRAHYQGDVITCVLRDGFTRAERTLIDAGRASAALAHRHELQQAVRADFITTVEEIVGRQVIGFFSGSQPDPDIEVEVFVLASPTASDQSSKESRAPDWLPPPVK